MYALQEGHEDAVDSPPKINILSFLVQKFNILNCFQTLWKVGQQTKGLTSLCSLLSTTWSSYLVQKFPWDWSLLCLAMGMHCSHLKLPKPRKGHCWMNCPPEKRPRSWAARDLRYCFGPLSPILESKSNKSWKKHSVWKKSLNFVYIQAKQCRTPLVLTNFQKSFLTWKLDDLVIFKQYGIEGYWKPKIEGKLPKMAEVLNASSKARVTTFPDPWSLCGTLALTLRFL